MSDLPALSVWRPARQGTSLSRAGTTGSPQRARYTSTQRPPPAPPAYGSCHFSSPLFNNERVTQRFNELPGKVNQKGSPLSKRIISIGTGQRNTIIVGGGGTREGGGGSADYRRAPATWIVAGDDLEIEGKVWNPSIGCLGLLLSLLRSSRLVARSHSQRNLNNSNV